MNEVKLFICNKIGNEISIISQHAFKRSKKFSYKKHRTAKRSPLVMRTGRWFLDSRCPEIFQQKKNAENEVSGFFGCVLTKDELSAGKKYNFSFQTTQLFFTTLSPKAYMAATIVNWKLVLDSYLHVVHCNKSTLVANIFTKTREFPCL